MSPHGDTAKEAIFQTDIIRQLLENGWLLGKPENYNRELALYPEDLLAFVKETQDSQWQKYCKIYPANPEEKLLEKVAASSARPTPMQRMQRCAPSALWVCCAMKSGIAVRGSASASSGPSMI